MLFFINNPEKKVMISTKILSRRTVFNINDYKKVSWEVNQNIRMISGGSCDTEDWSNDADNSALHHRSKLHFKMQ